MVKTDEHRSDLRVMSPVPRTVRAGSMTDEPQPAQNDVPERVNPAEILALVVSCIKDIGDDYRSSGQDPDDDVPSMDLTVATNDKVTGWSFQTGDNSFTGGAYGLPHWAVVTLTRDCDPQSVVDDIFRQWAELTWDTEDAQVEEPG